ncbi:hypothetical protein ACJX0J_040562, partial [Zea mays]
DSMAPTLLTLPGTASSVICYVTTAIWFMLWFILFLHFFVAAIILIIFFMLCCNYTYNMAQIYHLKQIITEVCTFSFLVKRNGKINKPFLHHNAFLFIWERFLWALSRYYMFYFHFAIKWKTHIKRELRSISL